MAIRRGLHRPSRYARVGLRATQAEIDAIKKKIESVKSLMVTGVESAAYGEKRTEFRSMIELREILAALEEELADMLGVGARVRQIRMTTQSDKGL